VERERLRVGAGDGAMDRTLGSAVLFSIVWVTLASAVYFSLGVVADHALGMTPVVFLVATVFFGLAAMTYTEGASLHQDRGGSTVFARYAFDELWSFVAGWAIILDYIILVAVTALSATHYLAAFWAPLGRGVAESVLALAIIAFVGLGTVRGFSRARVRRLAGLVVADLVVQVLLVILGLALLFDGHVLTSGIQIGDSPSWGDTIFALGVATVVFTGLESAAGVAGEVDVRGAGLRRLISAATVSVAVVYVGIAVVAVTALPSVDGQSPFGGQYLEAPVLAITGSFEQTWLADGSKYVVAAAAVLTLVAAANSAMLGLARLAYSLSLNRQIPSALGRLHPTRSTPYVVIGAAALIAAGLTLLKDLDLLVGMYAFGALLGLTIAHASIVRLRYREPDRRRPYRMPLSVGFRGASLPLPAVLGGVLSLAAWISVIVTHQGARYAGIGWMVAGVVLYVVYRTTQGKSLTSRVTVPERSLLRKEHRREGEYGSILVPILGSALDDDIVQTAGRLAGEEHEDFDSEEGATIEALWVFEVPMSLPIDARLPEAQLERARAALRRAKAVGEEYQGVEVATATVRARNAGRAIVEEAQRRGVEVIILGADEPTRIRGGALLGGRGGPRDNFIGEATKYVLAKATVPVILTAPPAESAAPDEARAGAAEGAGTDGQTG
jgi:basic amino acid/polyamine antiporter, APA family